MWAPTAHFGVAGAHCVKPATCPRLLRQARTPSRSATIVAEAMPVRVCPCLAARTHAHALVQFARASRAHAACLFPKKEPLRTDPPALFVGRGVLLERHGCRTARAATRCHLSCNQRFKVGVRLSAKGNIPLAQPWERNDRRQRPACAELINVKHRQGARPQLQSRAARLEGRAPLPRVRQSWEGGAHCVV